MIFTTPIMTLYKSFYLLIVFLLGISLNIYAQTIQQIETELKQHLTRIDHFAYLSLKTEASAFDSLLSENIILEEKLIQYIKKNPEMLSYEFSQLKNENFSVATSPDRKFRIFSWDQRTGGSMHFYDNVFAYQINKETFAYSPTLPEGNPGGYYSDIYQLKDEKETFYLGYQHRVLSNRDQFQCIQVFNIEKGTLNEQYKKILTKSGYTATLGFSFNFFSVVDKKERPIRLIKYLNGQKTITIPVVDENGYVNSKKRITYQYNGNYFTKQSATPVK